MEETAHRESLTDIAEKKIFHYLRENRFRPGDRLPMEAELAEKFHISRTIIREALSRLRMMGFIESKKRRGMVVGHPSIFETIAKVIDPAFLDEEEQKDFFRLRMTIELGLADMLAEQLTEEDLAAVAIRPAEGAGDTGVTVCYNSVADAAAICPVLSPSALCINPLNWRTDGEPAPLNDSVTVRVDTDRRVLLVEGFDPMRYYEPSLAGLFAVGNYHLQELFFYRDALKENVILRTDAWYGSRKK